ncbi:MAG: type II toxin-antitoxin system VapC family toxin [Deltaproteobacteria bacterium]|nr:type II toxin-antitoxin system VapC family toxin [Deltaproteobacteria bacterium]
MQNHYLDTSALVKLYREESGTDEVERIFSLEESAIIISELAVVEFYSTLYRLLRMNEITDGILKSVVESFERDCKFRFLIKPIGQDIFNKAKEIITKHGSKKSIRTLDAIQLAVSLKMKDIVFVSADELLLECAKDEKLKVLRVG